jgi:hypothetical protein
MINAGIVELNGRRSMSRGADSLNEANQLKSIVIVWRSGMQCDIFGVHLPRRESIYGGYWNE